jgi:hypothetical protein
VLATVHLCAVLALLGTPRPAAAEATQPIAGTYRCASYNVSGGGGSCRTFRPLILQPDGTYEYSSTRGSWSARDGRLHLSESTLWGPGEIVGRDTVRFEYDYRGWRHTVTWLCAECGQSASLRPPPAAAPPSIGDTLVGVSLTLEFSERIGGVSGFVIVLADVARAYAHNAPLPEGAVQGVAWETSATAVGLATGRNTLRTGQRYVVFLSWPRESIAVALLELPRVSSDYTTTLSATLDGASVLSRLGPGSVPASPATSPSTRAMPSASSALPYPGDASSSAVAAPVASAPYPGTTSVVPAPAPYPDTTAVTPAGAPYPGTTTVTPATVPAGQSTPVPCHPLIPKYSQPGCVE